MAVQVGRTDLEQGVHKGEQASVHLAHGLGAPSLELCLGLALLALLGQLGQLVRLADDGAPAAAEPGPQGQLLPPACLPVSARPMLPRKHCAKTASQTVCKDSCGHLLSCLHQPCTCRVNTWVLAMHAACACECKSMALAYMACSPTFPGTPCSCRCQPDLPRPRGLLQSRQPSGCSSPAWQLSVIAQLIVWVGTKCAASHLCQHLHSQGLVKVDDGVVDDRHDRLQRLRASTQAQHAKSLPVLQCPDSIWQLRFLSCIAQQRVDLPA